jgi:hypothetical protein
MRDRRDLIEQVQPPGLVERCRGGWRPAPPPEPTYRGPLPPRERRRRRREPSEPWRGRYVDLTA